MKMDKEMLIKHHFWLVLVAVVPVMLLAIFGLFGGVAGAMTDKETATKTHASKLKSSTPKSQTLLGKLGEQKDTLYVTRAKLWESAWDAQKKVYDWPAQMSQLDVLKFGAPLSQEIRDDFIRGDRIYLGQFKDLPDLVKPTQFNGGSWANVLRHIPTWSRVPDTEEVWLAMEDFWIQKELLRIVAAINENVGRFTMTGDANDPFSRTFQSRIWEVQLTLEKKGNERILTGKLKNRSGRLQPLGLDKALKLKVWLSDNLNIEPVEFLIEGTTVKAGDTIPVVALASHKLDPDRAAAATELYKVAQEFDIQTVPVKRIEAIALGYPSSRTAKMTPLKMSPFSTAILEKIKADAEAASTSDTGNSLGGPMGGPMGMVGGPIMRGGETALGQGGSSLSSNPDDLTINGLIRSRYLETTPQVRRMPIGVILVADQAYMQDIGVQFSNSRLRFQVTQMLWNRFRGTLDYSGAITNSLTSPTGPMGGERDEDMIQRSGGGGRRTPMGAIGPMGAVGPFGLSPMGGGSFPGGPSASGLSNSTEDPFAGSLVEFSLYGTASIYEKYDKEIAMKGPDGSTLTLESPMTPMTPAPMTPTPVPMVEPMPMTPVPMVDPKANPPVEPKTEPKAQPKVEPKVEPKAQPKSEPKVEPKAQPKVEPKVEPKAQPKVEKQN